MENQQVVEENAKLTNGDEINEVNETSQSEREETVQTNQNGNENNYNNEDEGVVVEKERNLNNLDESSVDLGDALNQSSSEQVNESITQSTVFISNSEIVGEQNSATPIENDTTTSLSVVQEDAQNNIEHLSDNKNSNMLTSESVYISKSDLESSPIHSLDHEEVTAAVEDANDNSKNKDTFSPEDDTSLVDDPSAPKAREDNNENNSNTIINRVTPVDEIVRRDYESVSQSQIDAIDNEIAAKFNEFKGNESSHSNTSSSANNKTQSSRRIEDETFQKMLGNDSLQKKIVEYGEEGEHSRPLNGQMVTISYEAYLKDTDKLVDHNDNLSFILGDGDVISGLDMAVCLMDKNEKAEVIIESRHAYGSLGKLPDIPPNATLFYKVHLKNFEEITELNIMRPVERLSLAESKKLRGNFHYNRQDYHWAIISYKKGLNYLDEENLRGDEDEKDMEKIVELAQALRMNLALSNFKMSECREALNLLNQLLAAQPKHIKGLYIKGKVLIQMGETEEAIKCLTKSLQFDPNNTEVKKELTKAQTMHKVQYENEKRMYQKMISAVSKTEDEINKIKNKQSKSSKNKETASYIGYVAAGLFVAAASVGVALFARSKNLI